MSLPQRASDFVHRWRRTILHASACGAILAWGVVAETTPRRATVVSSGTPSELEQPGQDEHAALQLEMAPLPTPKKGVGPAPNPAAPRVPDAQLPVRTYVVEPGDSVRTIAQQFSVTNETIIWENDLTDPDMLRVGQELHILPFSGLIHEVRPGDTVASVANGYDALIQDVVGANRLRDPFIIVVGQKLAVPGGYRPLPRKVLVQPSAPAREAADSVQAPPKQDDQQAATVQAPAKRKLPALGHTPQEQFIASVAEAAVESADETGVPASVTIAQAILESYWGSSRLAREANNYFGIKAQTKSGSAGAIRFDVWEVIGGRNVMQSQAFRAYDSVAESFVDHGRFFLENGRYAAALAVRGDARQFAREVNRAGYATDPSYAAKLIGLMDRYDLYRYDAI